MSGSNARLNGMVGYYAMRGHYDGWKANCWNTTQRVFDRKVRKHWVDGDDMQDWLDANCVEVDPSEVRPGDIVAWYDSHCAENAAGLVHTAVLVKETAGYWMVFHKPGPRPYEYEAESEPDEMYEGDYDSKVYLRYRGKR
jgi:hypothetical protein